MFNYECYKQKGSVLGTCIDGFLFGACCRLPSPDDTTTTTTTTEVVVVVDNFVVSSRPTASDSDDNGPPLTNFIQFGAVKTNVSAATSQYELLQQQQQQQQQQPESASELALGTSTIYLGKRRAQLFPLVTHLPWSCFT